jgi:hypothetical protein
VTRKQQRGVKVQWSTYVTVPRSKLASYSGRLRSAPAVISHTGTYIQYVNLGYVPQKYQILVANVVGLAWAVYLSSVVNAAAGAGAGGGGSRDAGGSGGRPPDPFEAPPPAGASRREAGEAALESSLVKASFLAHATSGGDGRADGALESLISASRQPVVCSRPRVYAAAAAARPHPPRGNTLEL